MTYEQYKAIQRAHPNAVLLLQAGDFYQAFDEDARTLASATGAMCRRVTLGKRRGYTYGMPTATVDSTIQALLDKGHRVAVAQRVRPQDANGHSIERLVTDARMAAPNEERTVSP